MIFSVYSMVSLAVVIINWLIFLYVSLKIDRSKRPVSFIFLLLAIIAWQMVELVSRLGLFADLIVNIWRASTAVISFLGVLFFFVTAHILQIKIKFYYELLAVAFCFVVACLALFTDKIIKTSELMPWGNVYVYGDWSFLFFAAIVIFLLLAFFLLVWAQIKEKDSRKRKYLIIIAISYFTALVGGSLTDLFFPYFNIKILPIGGIMITALFLLVMAAMKRYAGSGKKTGRYSISSQIFFVFFLTILAYIGASNYAFIKYGMGDINVNFGNTTKQIEKIVIGDASDSITTLANTFFASFGVRTAEYIKHFLRMIELETQQLSRLNIDDQEILEKQLLEFYNSRKYGIWYNNNTDLDPIEIRENIPLFSEVAFVDATGLETVKITKGQISTDLKNVSIPGNTEFQNERYFEKTAVLKSGEIYVSRLNTWYTSQEEAKKKLGDDAGELMEWEKLPGRDIIKTGNIKFATPVYAEGEFKGIFVLSLDYRHIQELVKHFDPLRTDEVVSVADESNAIILFDDKGDVIVHPRPNYVRGYVAGGQLKNSNTIAKGEGILNLKDYNRTDSYKKIFEKTVIEKENFVSSTFESDGKRKISVSVPIFYNKGEYKETGLFGGLLLTVSADNFYKLISDLDAEMNTLTQKGNVEIERIIKKSFMKYLSIGSAAALFLLAILMIILNKSIFYPLKVLSKASEEIGRGNLDVDLRVKTNNEIGELALSFQNMVGALNNTKHEVTNYSAELKENVAEKTKELNQLLEEMKNDRQNLERQRTATLNILEDVSQSQLDLKKANDELAAKSQELAALKSLSDEFVGVFDIFEAVMVANNYLVKFFDFTTINYLVINPAEEGGIIYTTYLQEDVSEKYLRKAEEDLFSYIRSLNVAAMNSTLGIIKSIVPKYIGKKLDNSLDFLPEGFLYFPLTIGEKNLGTIQATIRVKTDIADEKKEFIKAIVLALSFSIDRLETLILAQHSKTVSLVESLTDGVVMFNSNKDVVLMNPAFAKYTGFSREYFNLNDLYKLLSGLALQEMVASAITSGKTSHVNEVSLIKRFYEIFITPVRDNKGKIVGGAIIIHDITFLKEIDQMKTEFVSVASHQLRTPLTAIKLFTEMLVRGDVGKLNAEQQEYLENVNESTERMVSLVNDLLNVTRIESGRLSVNPQPVDIIKFIKNIIAEAKPLISSRTQKIVFHDNGLKLGAIPLDENLARQVIHNLVVNAIRYSPEKNGLIEVSLNKYDDKNIVISVKDNGIGIPLEAQRRIFEKFYRADNAIKSITEGTGLGLYVSKMIVVSFGGKIWFESKKGEGTEFFVELPLQGMEEKKGERGLAIS